MRLTTIGSVVALAISGAALAQVGTTPTELKSGQNTVQNTTASDNMATTNATAPGGGDATAANSMIPVPDSTAGSAPPKG